MFNRKAQVAPELMLGIGIIMTLFILITIFAVNKQIEVREVEDYINQRNECLKLANVINSLYINGPGTSVRLETDYYVTFLIQV